jgi:hypothetical protein
MPDLSARFDCRSWLSPETGARRRS